MRQRRLRGSRAGLGKIVPPDSLLTEKLSMFSELTQLVSRKGKIRIQLSSPYPIALFTKLINSKVGLDPLPPQACSGLSFLPGTA